MCPFQCLSPAASETSETRPWIAAVLAIALAACGNGQVISAESEGASSLALPATDAGQPELGVMGTIPLYWGESSGLGEVLAGEGEAHWARAPLEQRFALRPMAAITPENLAGLDYLLMAQPRGLAPDENVVLDAWVREGGRLLLFADPMMTGHSRFSIGDRRRPQDVILLSPILAHWGLALEFDDGQPDGTTTREIAGVIVPVNLPGRFAPPVQGGCTLEAQGVLASCKLGEGQVVVLADAALLDLHEPAAQAGAALAMLLRRAFGEVRESAGSAAGTMPSSSNTAPPAFPEPLQNPP